MIAFGAYWVIRNHGQLGEAAHRMQVWPIVGALLCGGLAAWSGVPAWRSVLSGLGSELPFVQLQRIFLIGQLGKYIPGGVWTVIAQARMAKDHQVPTERSGAASLMTVLLSVITGGALGGVLLAIGGREVLGTYWWTLLVLLPLAALLYPGVFPWLGRTVGRLLHRTLTLERVPERNLLAAAGWLTVGQIFGGLQFHLLVGMIGGDYSRPLLDIGLFLLASSAGIVVVFASAGAGVREVILAVGLSSLMDSGSALLVILLSRAVLTIVDIVVAAAAAGTVRFRRRRDRALEAIS